MTPSTHGAAHSWRDESWSSAEIDEAGAPTYAEPLFDQDATDVAAKADANGHLGKQRADEDVTAAARSDARAEGLPSRAVIVAGAAAVAVCTALDLALTSGRVTFFFDLCFVVVCLVTAMSVRRSDLFTAGVLPPLLYAGVVAVLAVVAPHAFGVGSGVATAFLTGLAGHAAGLVAGYAVALITVAARFATRDIAQP